VLELPTLTGNKDRTTSLTDAQISACVEAAALGISKSRIIELWKDEQAELPIGEFKFSRPTPPLSDLDFSCSARRTQGDLMAFRSMPTLTDSPTSWTST
jgi:hypothetical protein